MNPETATYIRYSSKHTGIRSLFVRNWVSTERFPASMGKFYSNLFENRLRGDYQDLVAFVRADIEAWFQEAKEFIKRVNGEIEERLPKSN
jgi:uncharacterized protein (UPF0332 family)